MLYNNKDIKMILEEALFRYETKGFCKRQYAKINSKTNYEYTKVDSDEYSLDGMVWKICMDLYREHLKNRPGVDQGTFNSLQWYTLKYLQTIINSPQEEPFCNWNDRPETT